MRKYILLLSSTLMLLNLAQPSVYAESNKDRITEIESQISSLQSELDELVKKDETTSEESSSDEPITETESDILGTYEADGLTYTLTDAYLVDDPLATSGKSVIFFLEFDNQSGEPEYPFSSFMYYIDAKQESDIQIFDLSMALLNNRYNEPTLTNASIALKDGASIEFELAFQLELLDGPITLIGSTIYDEKDEVILTLDPKKLDELP